MGFHTEDTFDIFHPGPAQIYLGKVDGALEETVGDDLDWFKIAYIGPANETHWKTYHKEEVTFSIPESTPPGKYLLRIEHIYLQQDAETTQFYMNCAHIEIIGSGGGKMIAT